VIKTMMRTMERDGFTAGHQRRVADLAGVIAEEMGLSEEEVRRIRMAGIIHDIGKIYVPAEILRKCTQLSPVEMEMMKIHPEAGRAIVDLVGPPWPVAEVVLQHHERMNGSGYPRGLCEHEILLEARILGVADVVEAMASDRPYRPAYSLAEALEEIRDNAGALYDPDVVAACFAVFEANSAERARAGAYVGRRLR
jgi:HD-GYP domain-containing protein (c-di-GMP phosphodiesterase class II)